MLLPDSQLKIVRDGEKLKVWDRLRKKYVALTPEEYVRQRFVNYLVDHLHYPTSIMANEHTVSLNSTTKRCDTVVWLPGRREPLMIVEYKASEVPITQDVFDQIARYNMALHADYLVVTNGVHLYCCRYDRTGATYHFLPAIPDFKSITSSVSDN